VFAFVPDKGTNRFFVLTQSQVNKEIVKEIEAARARAVARGESGEKASRFPCVSWPFVQAHEDKWDDVLPK